MNVEFVLRFVGGILAGVVAFRFASASVDVSHGPLHDILFAYLVLALSFAMDYFWFAFLVSWLIKLVLVRYGGMRTHTAAAPFFLGLILGDYVAGSIWAIYGPAVGITTYKIFI